MSGGIFDVGSLDPPGFRGPVAEVQKETGGVCEGISLALVSRACPESAVLLSTPQRRIQRDSVQRSLSGHKGLIPCEEVGEAPGADRG